MKNIVLTLTSVLCLFSLVLAGTNTHSADCNGNNDNCYQTTGGSGGSAATGTNPAGQGGGKGGSAMVPGLGGVKGAGGKSGRKSAKGTGRTSKGGSAKSSGLQRRSFGQLFTRQPYFDIIDPRAAVGGNGVPSSANPGADGISGPSQGQGGGPLAPAMEIQEIVQMINNNERLPEALQPLVYKKAKELGLNPPDPSTQKPTPSHLQGHPSTKEIQMLQGNNIPPAIVQAAKAQWGGGGSSQMSNTNQPGVPGGQGQSSVGGLGGGSQNGAVSRRYANADVHDYGFALSERDLDDDLELYIRGFEGDDFDIFVRDLPSIDFDLYERGLENNDFYVGYED